MSCTMETFLHYLSREPDRHGNDRIYVRRNGKRIRIREQEGTAAFTAACAAALDRLGPPPSKRPRGPGLPSHPVGTFGWAGARYFVSKGDDEFLTLDAESQRARRTDLEACFAYPLSDEHPDPMGNCPLQHLSVAKMKRLIEAKDGAGARTNRRKHLSAFCSWMVNQQPPLISTNLVRDTKAGRAVRTDGYYTWLIPDVQQFLTYYRAAAEVEATRVRSLKAILALGLLLFAGSRRQDMVTLGRQNCRGATPGELGDWIRYVPKKTIKAKGRRVSQKPLLPVLRSILVECAEVLGDLTFLVTAQGKAFSEAGIGNWMRDRCDEAGLPQCTAHGLKKAGATIAAENGATTKQLMAMFDWDSPDMAEVYTRAAEQKHLAGEAMFLITLEQKPERILSHPEPGVVAPAEKAS